MLTAVPTSAKDLEEQLVDVARSLERGLAHWLNLVGEYDALAGAQAWGFAGTAEWLSWACQISPRTAREHVRVAQRLRLMPATRAAFARGDITFSKARALTRAAEFEDEMALLALARASTAGELERRIAALRSAGSADADVAEAVHAQRDVQWWSDHQGALHLRGRFPAEDGAQLVEAIETAAEAMHGMYVGTGPRPRRGSRYADALAEIAISGSPRAQVVLHVDPAALTCTATEAADRAGEICHLEAGPAICSETARRLCCDADLTAPDLGRSKRVVSPALQQALERRDQGCVFPGCTRRHGLHAHHIKHWAHGGATDRDNLILLCRAHHRVVHEGGFAVHKAPGQPVVFVRPTGEVLTARRC